MQAFTLGPIQTKWLESLENNPERQMKDQLGKKYEDGSYTACCLGEAGLIAGVCQWDDDGYLVSGKDNLATLTHCGAIGLRSMRGERLDGSFSLAIDNDNGLTWPEIAAKIRAEPEQYFTHSV